VSTEPTDVDPVGDDEEDAAALELLRATAGLRAVLAAAGCVTLPSLADFLG
jgi:hypothetical protein